MLSEIAYSSVKKLLIASLLATPMALFAHGGSEHGELTIRMNEKGFEPKELTIIEGDEVIFINNDDVERWPASNFHPTHTLYPEFDPQKGIPPGGSWKMTFNEVGAHRMHDHLIPHMTGTIVVLEDPEEDTANTRAKSAPKSESSWWRNIKAFFSRVFQRESSAKVEAKALTHFKTLAEKEKHAWLEAEAERAGPESAWQYVLAAYTTPEGVVGNAHDMAHLVGQLLFKEKGFDGLSICTPVFAFGCYHGLMEVAFHKNTPEAFARNLIDGQKACGRLGDGVRPPYWSCIHGIGHGIITYREHDVQQALKDCDQLHENIRTYCYDGAFMELSLSAANFYKKSDPLFPCDAVDKKYRFACARSQPIVMRTKFNLETKDVARLCRESGDEAIRYHCIDAVGYFMGQMSGGRAEKIINGCGEIANADDRAQCMAAAAGELVFQDTAGWRESSREVCEALQGEKLDLCSARIEGIKKSYGRN